jgi:hypothetical protein
LLIIRYGLKNLDVLEAELRAFKRADPEGNRLGVFLPFITSVEELQKVRDLMIEIDFEPKVGIILETPASVQLIKDFLDSNIDSVFIDVDKLLGYLLSIDLSNESVSHLYDPLHPALKYQLEYVIRVCKRRGIKIVFSGEALLNEDLLQYLVRKEVSSICVLPERAKDFSELIFEFEEEIFRGTDKEPRQYEIQKEKKEYLEEVPKTMEDLEVIEETEKVTIPVSEEVMEDIEAIEEEKQEYLEGHPEEKKEYEEDLVSGEDVLSELSSDEEDLKEDLNEEFDEEVEDHTQEEKEEDSLGIL